jgi:hypothetical protein
LELFPGPLTNDATFANRLVSASHTTVEGDTILTCEIKAAAMAANGETWRIQARATGLGSYQLTQADNSAQTPTISRVMCDPVARFSIGGEATQSAGGIATVREKGSVTLQATAAIGPATIVQVAELAQPKSHYRWSLLSSSVGIPELPACSESPQVAFFAPHVVTGTELKLRLETWFEGACPQTVGWLNATADVPLRVEPVGETFLVGPEASISPGDWLDMWAWFLLDKNDGIIAVWSSFGRPGGPKGTICTSRLNLHDLSAGFSPAQRITAVYSSTPAAVLLPDGELVVAYRRDKDKGLATEVRNICFKRARLDGLTAAPEQLVSADLQVSGPSCFLSGDIISFFYDGGSHRDFRLRRYRPSNGTWLDSAPQPLLSKSTFGTAAAVAQDPSGNLWFSFTSNMDSKFAKEWRAFRFTPETGSRSFEVARSFTGESAAVPSSSVFCVPSGDIWVFLRTNTGPQLSQFAGGSWRDPIPVPHTATTDTVPQCLVDSAGSIWLFWLRRNVDGTTWKNVVMRHNPATGKWDQPRALPLEGGLGWVLITPNNTIWVFYSRQVKDKPIITQFYRRILI